MSRRERREQEEREEKERKKREKAEKKRTQDFAHLRFAKNTEKMIGFYLCKRRGKSGKKTAGFACRERLRRPKERIHAVFWQ